MYWKWLLVLITKNVDSYPIFLLNLIVVFFRYWEFDTTIVQFFYHFFVLFLNPISPEGGGFRPPQETFLNNSKTAKDIKLKFFKFNLTLMGVMLHIVIFLICLRCCHSNLLLCMCRGIKKGRKLHICQDIGLILLKFGAGGYFWILSPKSTIKFLCDVIFTSK